jgi:hypothetical protein
MMTAWPLTTLGTQPNTHSMPRPNWISCQSDPSAVSWLPLM